MTKSFQMKKTVQHIACIRRLEARYLTWRKLSIWSRLYHSPSKPWSSCVRQKNNTHLTLSIRELIQKRTTSRL